MASAPWVVQIVLNIIQRGLSIPISEDDAPPGAHYPDFHSRDILMASTLGEHPPVDDAERPDLILASLTRKLFQKIGQATA